MNNKKKLKFQKYVAVNIIENVKGTNRYSMNNLNQYLIKIMSRIFKNNTMLY